MNELDMAKMNMDDWMRKLSPRILMAVMLISLILIGFFYVRIEKRKRIDEKQRELTAVTAHKITRIESWMKERMADASHFSVSPLYADALFNWLQTGDTLIGRQLEQRNQLIINLRGFKDVMMVVDENPVMFTADKPHAPLNDKLKRLTRTTLSQKGIYFTSFLSGRSTTEPYIAISAPICKGNQGPFAVLIFLIDPNVNLFPIISGPSGLSANGITAWLVERMDGAAYKEGSGGGQSIYFSGNGGLETSIDDSSKIPLEDVYQSDMGPNGEPLTAGMLGRKDHTLDIGSQKMLFSAIPIDGTPWMLMSMEEKRSVVNPVYWMAFLMGTMVVGVLFTLGLGLSLVEKHKTQSRLENLLENEKQALQRAITAEARIRNMVDNSFDAVLFFDDNGSIAYASDKVKAYLGLDGGDGFSCNVWDLFGKEDSDHFRRILKDEARCPKKDTYPVRMRIASNQWHWVEASFHTMDESSLQGQWVLNIMDVHERKSIQEKLDDLRLFQTYIVDNAGYAIIATDQKGVITLFNHAAEKMFGYASDEVIGKQTPTAIHLPSEIAERAHALTQKLGYEVKPDFEVFVVELQHYPSDEREWTFVRKDGSQMAGTLKVTWLKDSQDNVTGYIGVVVDLTQYKAQEERMREQDVLLRDYHKMAKLGAYRLNTQTGQWVCTDVLDEIFGLSHNAVKNIDSWVDLLFEDDRTMMLDYFNNDVLTGYRTFDKRYRICRKSDSLVRWVHGRGELEFGPGGDLCYMIGTIRDITDQVAIEQSIKLSEQRYKQLFANMSGGFALHECVTDEAGDVVEFRFLDANPTFETMVKVPKRNVFGKKVSEVMRDAEFWVEKFKAVVRSGRSDKFVKYLSSLRIYVEAIIYQPIPNQVATILYDVTERIITDGKLRESEQKFSIFYNLNPDGAGITRFSDGILLDVNPAFTQLLEYTPEECLGKSTQELGLWYAPDDRILMAKVLGDLGMVDNYEFRARAKSGKVVDTLFSSKRITYRGEDCMLFIVRDITERKKHENQIRILNEQLERKVEERTLQLAQANKDLEAFSYSVSHDLRAPLRHVDGFMRLMYAQIQNPSDAVKAYYEKINSASHRMSAMIDDLLQFSRLGRKEITYLKVDMQQVVDEIIEQISPDVANRRIEWIVGQLPMVEGDKSLLRIAFENLIDNAVKYTSKRSGATIEIGSVPIDNAHVDIYIKDNGVGFNMAYVDKLFGVFQRLHSSDEFEGSGIGLANVKRIIQRHGGNIKVDAAVDQGATFFVTLKALI
ncbi:MAG: PAS domain S-box protein [Breznakibacter sp.]